MEKYQTITTEEIKAGFINSEVVNFENRILRDKEFLKQVAKEEKWNFTDIHGEQ